MTFSKRLGKQVVSTCSAIRRSSHFFALSGGMSSYRCLQGVQGAGFRVQGSGCRVQGAGFRVQGSGCRVQGAEFRVQGSEHVLVPLRPSPSLLYTLYDGRRATKTIVWRQATKNIPFPTLPYSLSFLFLVCQSHQTCYAGVVFKTKMAQHLTQ